MHFALDLLTKFYWRWRRRDRCRMGGVRGPRWGREVVKWEKCKRRGDFGGRGGGMGGGGKGV
jgi:hypothetical protein